MAARKKAAPAVEETVTPVVEPVETETVQSSRINRARESKGSTMAEDTESSIIDFSEDIDSQEQPEPLPVSEYMAEIKAVEKKESKEGKNYADITFYIGVENYPRDYDPINAPDGWTLHYRRLSLEDTPAARFAIRQFCEKIGAPMPKRSLDLNEWVGLSTRVGTDLDEYEGVTRPQIVKIIGE